MSEYIEQGPAYLNSPYSSGYIPTTEIIVDSVPEDGKIGVGVWSTNHHDNESLIHLTRAQVETLMQHLNDLLLDQSW